MNKPTAFAAIICVILLASSCTGATSPDLDASDDPSKGSVRLSIPALGPSLLRYAEEARTASAPSAGSRNLGSKAYLAASYVRLEFFQGGASPVCSYEVPVSGMKVVADFDGTTAAGSCKATLPVGTGYTVKATIFNQANGTDEASRATVSGSSASFDIASLAETPVSVSCLPIAPIELGPGVESAKDSLTPYAGYYLSPTYNKLIAGGERWYKITPAGASTRLLAKPVEGSRAALAVFLYDAAGKEVAAERTKPAFVVPGTGAAAYFTSVPGATYYAAVIDSADSIYLDNSAGTFEEGEHGYTLSYGPAAADSAESDDSISTAKTLAVGTRLERSIYPAGDVDYFAFKAEAGQGYDIVILPGEGTRPAVEFTIVDALGDTVGSAECPFDGSIDIARITQLVLTKADTYYVAVSAQTGGLFPGKGRALSRGEGGLVIPGDTASGAVIGAYALEISPNRAPQNLAVKAGTEDPYHSILASWSAVAGATTYRLYGITDSSVLGRVLSRATASQGTKTATVIYEGEALSYLHQGLTAGRTYYYQAAAFVDGAWTSLSAQANARTENETYLNVYIR